MLACNFMHVHDPTEPGRLETRTLVESGLYSVP